MLQFLKSFAVAFSLYSRIPMPRFNWNSGDMKYHFIFFPFVGAVIALLEILLKAAQIKFGFGQILYLCAAVSLPVFITGGIHLDGFMDTMDAVSSYGTKEKKLEILKDPHTGAFAVISAVVYFLMATGFLSEVNSFPSLVCTSFSFIFSRILSAFSVLFIKKARKDGMAKTESETASKRITGTALLAEFFILTALLVFLVRFCLNGSVFILTAFFISLGVSYAVFFFTARHNFGGVSGDTAGFLVCITELLSVIAIAVSKNLNF